MSDLHEPILEWYDEHARDLPWRGRRPRPWSVMVSEFMLQQTPVARVLPVHEAWLRALADARPTLAAEPTGEAVRAWGRLGYPRRALRLHAAATAIVERHDGEVPASYDDLLALPGVGDYTAAAIASLRLRPAARRARHQRAPGARPARSPASSSPPPSVTRAERDARRRAAARRRADRGHLGGRGDGARRAGLHGRATRAAAPARSPTCARGARPATRRTTGRRARCRPGPAPTGSAAAGCWPCCATPRARCTAARLDAAWAEAAQRERCLASLVDDGLVVRTPTRHLRPALTPTAREMSYDPVAGATGSYDVAG